MEEGRGKGKWEGGTGYAMGKGKTKDEGEGKGGEGLQPPNSNSWRRHWWPGWPKPPPILSPQFLILATPV